MTGTALFAIRSSMRWGRLEPLQRITPFRFAQWPGVSPQFLSNAGSTTVNHSRAAWAKVNGATPAQSLNIPWPAVIAHRGASFYAPESTKPSYLLAHELSADYLEADLQRTRDGHLIARHDVNLQRTTNISEKFPDHKNLPVNDFTLAELKTLDAGSWFNIAHSERARPRYAGAQLLTLQTLIDIAEQGPASMSGLYVETKQPLPFPDVEKDLETKLRQRLWLAAEGSVAAGHRLILETFEKHSLSLLNRYIPHVPKLLLLWLGDGFMAVLSDTPYDPKSGQTRAAHFSQQQPLM